MVGFLRLCSHFAKRKLFESARSSEDLDTPNLEPEGKRIRLDSNLLDLDEPKRSSGGLEADQINEIEIIQDLNVNKSEDSNEVIEEGDRLEEESRLVFQDEEEEPRLEWQDDEEEEEDLDGDINKAIEEQLNTVDRLPSPPSSPILELVSDQIVVHSDLDEDEEYIDVVSVTPVPDLGQTQVLPNLFLQNYFNPDKDLLKFPFQASTVTPEYCSSTCFGLNPISRPREEDEEVEVEIIEKDFEVVSDVSDESEETPNELVIKSYEIALSVQMTKLGLFKRKKCKRKSVNLEGGEEEKAGSSLNLSRIDRVRSRRRDRKLLQQQQQEQNKKKSKKKRRKKKKKCSRENCRKCEKRQKESLLKNGAVSQEFVESVDPQKTQESDLSPASVQDEPQLKVRLVDLAQHFKFNHLFPPR